MPDKQPKRAAILVRISEARDDDTAGVDRQEKDCRAKLADLGWTLGPEATHVIVENDTSAFKRRMVCRGCLKPSQMCTCRDEHERVPRTYRPEYRRLLQMLQSGQADGAVVYDIDRAFRDPMDAEDFLNVVDARHLYGRIKSVTGSLRLDSPADITNLRIMVSVANQSSRDTARRVARKRLDKAQKGLHGGGRRSFGYGVPTGRKNAKGEPVLDLTRTVPAEAEEIRSWARQLLEGGSLKAIVADLRVRGVPTVNGGRWDYSSVRDILLRPSLAGLVVYQQREAAREYRERGERVPYDAGVLPGVKGKWEPVLDEDTWRAVAELLTDPSRRTNEGKGNTPRWLGSLIYKCGPCAEQGIEETVSVNGPRRDRYGPTYGCRNTGTGHLRRSAGPVDAFVEELAIQRLAEPDFADLFTSAGDEVDRKALTEERAKAQRGRAKLLRMVADEVISEADARLELTRLADRISEIDAELNAAAERGPFDGMPLGTDVETVAKAWAALPLQSKRMMIRALMEVTLHHGTPGRKPVSPELKAHRADCAQCADAARRHKQQEGCPEGVRLWNLDYFDPSTISVRLLS